MGRDKQVPPARDPLGHSARVYDFIYDSKAWASLSPHDVLAYLALLRDLRATNNGDLSLTLTLAKSRGISHHVTLARSLRALCAVGLAAITRKGGCKKGGEREPTLYRLTHRDSSEYANKNVEAVKASNEWKRVTSAEHGRALIQAAEDGVKKATAEKKNAGHVVTATVSSPVLVEQKIRTPRDILNQQSGHVVTMVETIKNPASVRVVAGFLKVTGKASHRTPTRPPLYLAIHSSETGIYGNRTTCHGGGTSKRIRDSTAGLFTCLLGMERLAV